MLIKVSVIIPLAPKEAVSGELEKQLLSLPEDWEILICSSHKPQKMEDRFHWIQTGQGRAGCQNCGAKYAQGQYLWFLHADSLLVDNSTTKLNDIMKLETGYPGKMALYYFDLKFIRLSNHFMRPKEIGVLFRSRCLHTPFGDQGFFMNRKLFDQMGPYSTEAAYGEDHLFVRKLRRSKIEILPVGMSLYTSPRKYEQNGWVRTTIKHQYLWLKQAFEDWLEHKGDYKNENSTRSILQDSGFISCKNAFRGSDR